MKGIIEKLTYGRGYNWKNIFDTKDSGECDQCCFLKAEPYNGPYGPLGPFDLTSNGPSERAVDGNEDKFCG